MNAPEVLSGVAASAAGAGLVPSKTSRQTCINLAPSAVAERRVKRLKKSVWASGHLHGISENGFRAAVPWFVTLTYAHADNWHARQIVEAIRLFRSWCTSKNVPCRYTWVAELTPSNGRVHYHLLAWLPPGLRMPHWDRPTRKRGGQRPAFWQWGMSQTEVAKSGVGYLMKYLSKLGELTRFPKGLRLYGIGGLNDTGRKVRSWYNLPEWVKRSYGVGEVLRSAGRLLVRATGELLDSPYKVSLMPFGLVVHQLREIPPRFHDGAYSTVSFS
jgi:hypothetical protein